MTSKDFFKRYTYDLDKDRLGEGAFGTVYKAYDNVLDREVAIKIAEIRTLAGKTFSLLDEFEAIRNISKHTNIANYEEVYTFNQPAGKFDFAIIQYYPDGNLSDLIKKDNLSLLQKEKISLQILEGLEFLHTNKVVHRDMKPSNVLIYVRNNGDIIPKIADFGLSKKVTSEVQSRFTNSFGGGTLAYSSPEQIDGKPLFFNTDLWAWAVITYELFTGKRLFDVPDKYSTGSAKNEQKLVEQILNKDIAAALADFPENWRKALTSCLKRNPIERVKKADEVIQIIGNDNTYLLDTGNELPTKIDQIDIADKKGEKEESEEVGDIKTVKHKRRSLWLGLSVVFLVLMGSYIWKFDNIKTLIKPNTDITLETAQRQYEQLQEKMRLADINSVKDIFASEIEKYHSLNNTTKEVVIADAKKYLDRWQVVETKVIHFSPDLSKNRFKYKIQYTIENRETKKRLRYLISGKVGFVYKKGTFKINYLDDIKQKKEGELIIKKD